MSGNEVVWSGKWFSKTSGLYVAGRSDSDKEMVIIQGSRPSI